MKKFFSSLSIPTLRPTSWEFLKNLKDKKTALEYGGVSILVLGLFLQQYGCSIPGLCYDLWFARSGALLVCYSLICFYANHGMVEVVDDAIRKNNIAKRYLKQSNAILEGTVNAFVDYHIKLRKESIEREKGESISLDMQYPGKDSTYRDVLEKEARNNYTAPTKSAFDSIADQHEREQHDAQNFTQLLTKTEFTAAITGTFVWGFGDIRLVQFLTMLGLFYVCVRRSYDILKPQR